MKTLPLRVDEDLLRRLDELAEQFEQAGVSVTRSTLARRALRQGLPELERSAGLLTPLPREVATAEQAALP